MKPKSIRKSKSSFFLPFFALIGIATLSACGSSGHSTSNNMNSGILTAYLTDSSGCNFDQVVVTVSKVRVHQSANARDNDSGWSEIILSLPRKINLLTLQGTLSDALGSVELSKGHYTQVSLVLVPNVPGSTSYNNFVTLADDPTHKDYPLFIPDGYKNGIRIAHEFSLNGGETEDLILDFDACHSVVSIKNGSTYLLKPNILAIRKKSAGSIVGFVATPASSSSPSHAVAKAEIKDPDGNYFVYRQTAIQSDGSFVLYPLPSSATISALFPAANTNGSYDILIVADNYSTVVTTDVPVTNGATTALSTRTDPILLSNAVPGVFDGFINPTSADVRIRQTILDASSRPRTYQIRRERADLFDGSFTFELSPGNPVSGAYSPILPITFPGTTAGGSFTVDTPNDDGLYQVKTAVFNIAPSTTTTINFTGANSLIPTQGVPGIAGGDVTVYPPFGITSGFVLMSAMMNGEVVNTKTVHFSGSFSVNPYSIDDLAPGPYKLTVLFVPPGFGTIVPPYLSTNVALNGTATPPGPFSFTVSP